MDYRLILTPTSTPKRSLTSQLRALPSYIIPPPLLIPTILHSLITPTISHSTPLLLRSHLAIDPILTPNTYQLARFVSRTLELFLKLPLETVLRRGQMAVLESPTYKLEGGKELESTVKLGEYRGVVGTIWLIAREEGVRENPLSKGKKGKGKVEKGRTSPSRRHPWMRSNLTICASGVCAEGEKCGSPRSLRCG